MDKVVWARAHLVATVVEHIDVDVRYWPTDPEKDPVPFKQSDLDKGVIEEEIQFTVILTKKSYDCGKDGLVYLDKTWLKELAQALNQAGFTETFNLRYTEQGMQNSNGPHLILGNWQTYSTFYG